MINDNNNLTQKDNIALLQLMIITIIVMRIIIIIIFSSQHTFLPLRPPFLYLLRNLRHSSCTSGRFIPHLIPQCKPHTHTPLTMRLSATFILIRALLTGRVSLLQISVLVLQQFCTLYLSVLYSSF